MVQKPPSAIAASVTNGAGNYYLQVYALTAKETTSGAGSPNDLGGIPTASPYLIWLPYIVFFILFISAFGLLIANKIWNWKRIAGAMVLAGCLAAIPYVISAINRDMATVYRAGPEERPKQIEIIRQSKDSVIINWLTDTESVGAVRYGTIPFTQNTAKVIVTDAGTAVGKHTLKISGLKPNTAYGLEIYSGSHWYDNQGKALEFKTRR
jgi:hypothetical protein